MFLQLPPNNAFWSLVEPDTRELIVHLTFQNPGPVKVDYDNLPPHLKQIIDRGIQLGNILRVDVEPPKPQEEIPEEETTPKVGGEDRRVLKQKLNVDVLLELGIRGIRDQLRTNLYDVEYITRAIETEKQGKNRQTVIRALEQKLNKYGGAGAVIESDKEEIQILLE